MKAIDVIKEAHKIVNYYCEKGLCDTQALSDIEFLWDKVDDEEEGHED